MANAIYPEYKEFLLSAAANVSLNVNDATDGPFVQLTDTGAYTYNAAHDFYDDAVGGIVGTSMRITSPTVANGTFDGVDVTYTAVTGATVEALVIYRHNSGANTTWKLVAYIDTSVTGLPVTPNGGDITVTWNASGIFLISDARAKEDIRKVGQLPNGISIYDYRYIGTKHVQRGFIAQDVEKVIPCAVAQVGRYKAVDYWKVLEAA